MSPRSPERPHATSADLAECRALLRGGSRSFHAAAVVLPQRVRDAATSLYAFCRLADDAVDLGADPRAGLQRLRERLAGAYEGRPQAFAADRAFADVIERYGIPRALPEALLEGFEWDAERRRYADLEALTSYATRVAGTVGGMMTMLMGVREPTVVARACDLGIAMQFTNIARDVGEDARNGRLYLPLDWLRDVGIDPEAWLARPLHSPALASVVQRLLVAADELYARADGGIAQLPAACRPGMQAARRLYAEIGREVERRGLDSVATRATVARLRKARTLAAAFRASLSPVPLALDAPLPAARFLVDAVASMPRQGAAIGPAVPSWWHFADRSRWVVELFHRLEHRERMAMGLTHQAAGREH